MSADTPWTYGNGPTFLRCKDAIIEVGQIVAIKKLNTASMPGPSRHGYKILVSLKKGETLSLDFSHDDEACGPEPRDRAFEDIWCALKRVR